ATVTIQELTFTLLVVAAAAPGLAHLPNGVVWMLAVTVGIIAIVALLTVPRLFDVARRSAAATPGVRRFIRDIEVLHVEVRRLLPFCKGCRSRSFPPSEARSHIWCCDAAAH